MNDPGACKYCPLEMLLSLIERNRLVVLFTCMPNFVSFMNFLFNSITHLKANSLCTQFMNIFCKYMYFLTFCWILQQIGKFFMRSSREEKVLGHIIKCKIGSFLSLHQEKRHHLKYKDRDQDLVKWSTIYSSR